MVAGFVGGGDELATFAVFVAGAVEAAHGDAVAGLLADAASDDGREGELGGQGVVDAIGNPLVEVADEVVHAVGARAVGVLARFSKRAGLCGQRGVVEVGVAPAVRVGAVKDGEQMRFADVASLRRRAPLGESTSAEQGLSAKGRARSRRSVLEWSRAV